MQMMRAPALVRLYRMDRERRRLLLWALLLLTAASAAVAALPFRVAIRFGAVPLKGRAARRPAECVKAIESVSRRLPWRTKCIEKGLAVQRLLRSGGVDALLHYGARHAENGMLEAHVWVSVDGETVIGGDEAPGFAELAQYP